MWNSARLDEFYLWLWILLTTLGKYTFGNYFWMIKFHKHHYHCNHHHHLFPGVFPRQFTQQPLLVVGKHFWGAQRSLVISKPTNHGQCFLTSQNHSLTCCMDFCHNSSCYSFPSTIVSLRPWNLNWLYRGYVCASLWLIPFSNFTWI